MDTTRRADTPADLARALGVSLSRVHRHLDRHGVASALGKGHVRHVPTAVSTQLLAELGAVPTRYGHLTRPDMLVLAAVLHSHVGVTSAREVARRTRLSPSTASASLDALTQAGLVETRTRMEARGNATEVTRWHPAGIGQWSDDLRRAVHSVHFPDPAPRPAPTRVPRTLFHLFWSHPHPERLRLPADADYVAARLIDSGEYDPMRWALANLPGDSIRHAVARRGTPARTREIAQLARA